MAELTEAGRRVVDDAARTHSMSTEAVRIVLEALARSRGSMAQFNHPELGGMGQWSRGGMVMIGDMFNNALKAQVDALCSDLSRTVESGRAIFAETVHGAGGSDWWPQELGAPASSGAQNDMRYACFPDRRRLVVDRGGRISIHDTGEHHITGFSQQQGDDQSLTFSSQDGTVRLDSLKLVAGSPATPPRSSSSAPADAATHDVFTSVERLAGLRDKGLITDQEFAAKKAELLKRI